MECEDLRIQIAEAQALFEIGDILPVFIAVLNLYFGLFSGYIQTLVFASLNGVWIGNEMPEDAAMGATSQAIRPAMNKEKTI